MIRVNENATKEDSPHCTALKDDGFGPQKAAVTTGWPIGSTVSVKEEMNSGSYEQMLQ